LTIAERRLGKRCWNQRYFKPSTAGGGDGETHAINGNAAAINRQIHDVCGRGYTCAPLAASG
jgi:hypothetical protein